MSTNHHATLVPYRPARAGAVQVLRLPGDRYTLTGSVTQVSAVVEDLGASGRLYAVSDPAPAGDGQILVTVRLAPAGTPGHAVAPARHPRRLAVLAGVVAVVTAGLGWLVWAVLTWIAAHLAVLVGAGVAVAAVGLLGGGRVCKTVVTVVHRH